MSNGATVGITASATDADATDSVTFSLTDDANGRFTIDANTGVVTVADASQLDYESATTHDIEVTATSTDGSTSTQTYTINLTDDTSESSVSSISDANADVSTISESVSNGATVGITAQASDADVTDSVTYSLSDDAGGRFTIDANTGIVTVADASQLDYETATSHDIEVTATSSDGSTSTQMYTINTSDENEAPDSIQLYPDSGVTLNTNGGNDAYIYNSNGGDIIGGLSEFTIQLTVKTGTESANWTPLISYAAPGSNNELLLGSQASTGTINFFFSGSQYDTGIDSSEIFDGSSHTIALVRDASDGSIDIYIDGVNKYSRDSIRTGTTLDENGTLVIGQEQDSVGGRFAQNQIFSGTIDDVAIFNVAKEETDIQSDYNSPIDPNHSDLNALWTFDGVEPLQDKSGNGFDFQEGHVTGSGWSNGNIEYIPDYSIDEGLGSADIGELIVTDPDIADSHILTVDDARFEVVSGVLKLKDGISLDYETESSVSVNITATDDEGLSTTQRFTIQVNDVQNEHTISHITDVNDGPSTISESVSNGATVGITAQASDADATDSVTYSLTDDANGRFTIDANTGVVTVAGSAQLDYEDATSHDIEVMATSSDGSTSTQTYTVNLSDDTSESSVGNIIDTNADSSMISESVSNGATVGITAQATDADVSDTVTYSLSDDANGRFVIDANTGVVTVADASQLDYESATSHDIEVTATSSDGSISTQTYTVNLTDDTSEASVGSVSDADGSSSTISESVGNSATVGITAQASDADVTDSVTYSLSNDANGRFIIDANTGVVSVADNTLLDYESATSHDIEVTATSSDGSISTQTYTVNLTDDTSEASVGSVSDADGSSSTISESVSNGTAVGITAQATDADGTDSVTFSLSDDASGRFTIDANTGIVTVADSSQLDYESATSHEIEITATSSDGSTSTQSYTINLTDDASESSVGNISDTNVDAATVSESVSNGATVGITAQATDADATDSVTFSLSDDANGRFAIDPNTGVVTVADSTQLDYESATSHDIEITATSSDGSTSIQSYTIDISNANEAPGTISIDNSGLSAEFFNLNSRISSLADIDFDADADVTQTVDEVNYFAQKGSFSEGVNNDYFAAKFSGEINVENGGKYTFSMGSDDGSKLIIDGKTIIGNDGLHAHRTESSTITLSEGSHSIEVLYFENGGDASLQLSWSGPDTGNVQKVISGDDFNRETLSVEENTAGDVVGILATSDSDAADSHTYTVSDDRFEVVDDGSGNQQLKLKDGQSLDYDTEPSVTLTITSTDSGGLSTSSEFKVAVDDVGDNNVIGSISDRDSSASSISESAANGSAVGITVHASDADSTDTVKYSLSDDANGRFAIDASTGVITVADSSQLDYEKATSHDIEVTAISSDGSRSTESFTIDVRDVDEPDNNNLILNGSFEADGSASSKSWELISGKDFQFKQNGSGYVYGADGKYFLDMERMPGENISIAQKVSGITSDQSYQLSFDAADFTDYGFGDSSLNVYWNGKLVDTVDPNNSNFEQYSYLVKGGSGDGSGVLRFEETGGHDGGGTAIDNVSLVVSESSPPAQPITSNTIHGDRSYNNINATNANDKIYGYRGKDVLEGQDGGDIIYGGDDNDTMYGHSKINNDPDDDASTDFLYGERGNDDLYGGDGDDYLDGGSGYDELYGQDGNDHLHGGDENDDLYGGSGNDQLHGDDGYDWLYGNEGNDSLYGGDLNDRLYGGTGDDTLEGGSGYDYLYGEDGNDTFVIMEGMGDDDIYGGTGGDWIDVVQLQGSSGGDVTDGWTYQLNNGVIESSGDGYLNLSNDADGVINLQDGTRIDFYDIERIEW